MPKLVICIVFVVVGLAAVFSQVFRMDPAPAIVLGGLTLALLGGIGFADYQPKPR